MVEEHMNRVVDLFLRVHRPSLESCHGHPCRHVGHYLPPLQLAIDERKAGGRLAYWEKLDKPFAWLERFRCEMLHLLRQMNEWIIL